MKLGLALDVVNGENYRHALPAEREGNQACYCVVGVHDLHRFALFRALPDECRNRTRKRSEAYPVVDEGDATFAIDAFAVEEAGQVEQHELCAGRQLAVEHVYLAA